MKALDGRLATPIKHAKFCYARKIEVSVGRKIVTK